MVTSNKRVKIIIALGILAIVSSAFVLTYSYKTGPKYEPSPVDAWFGIGFERRQLEDDLENKVITKTDYKKEREKLVAQEDQIAKRYPRNMTEYKTYSVNKEKDQKHPIEFWIAIFSTFIASIGALSGMVLSWKSDRRAAIETEMKIIELQKIINNQSTNA